MIAPRYARLAGRLFLQERRSIPPVSPTPEVRTRAISAIERALEARRYRRRALQWAMAATSVAAAAAAVLVVRHEVVQRQVPVLTVAAVVPDAQILAHPVGAGAKMVVSGAQLPLPEGGGVRAGSRVVTPANGGVSLAFSTGTSAALDAWSDMTVVADGPAQLLRLDSGSVDLHVAKLTEGQRFILDTPDAEVEVRGTRFRVSIVPADPSCGRGTWTRVVVTEGVVEVRNAGSSVRVAAGEQWPGSCGRTANAETLDTSPSGGTVRHGGGGAASIESTLGAQNNLFARAAAAKRRGDTRDAMALLDRFLAKYPTSPLAESVMVERMRLLRSEDPSMGASAAAQYLTRYPNGFAHVEAASMVAEAP
jgi:ferric-dicitrate binding protein FerR (iron transport regulator)